jgi:hypothetical protein
MNTRITNWPASFSVFNGKRGRSGNIFTKETRNHGSVEKGAQTYTLHQILLGQSYGDGMVRACRTKRREMHKKIFRQPEGRPGRYHNATNTTGFEDENGLIWLISEC